MGREIKFRAWDSEDKRMIVHQQDFIPLIVTNAGILKLSPHHEEDLWTLVDTNRFEIMQYTGLKDSNGAEIYEGDLIRYANSNDKVRVITVSWNQLDAAYDFGGIRTDYAINGEVIGNIYENPQISKTI